MSRKTDLNPVADLGGEVDEWRYPLPAFARGVTTKAKVACMLSAVVYHIILSMDDAEKARLPQGVQRSAQNVAAALRRHVGVGPRSVPDPEAEVVPIRTGQVEIDSYAPHCGDIDDGPTLPSGPGAA